MARGKAEGMARGKAEGIVQGIVEGKIDSLLKLLSHRGLRVAEDQRRRICACADLATLDRWLDRVLLVASVDELLG
jgi:predicted transposase YdaD